MKKIYYIGGSPCSGKSTVAQMIAKQYNFKYYQVDDSLYDFIKMGQAAGKPYSSKAAEKDVNEIWLCDPVVANEEELEIYREIFQFIIEEVSNMEDSNPIIAEGVAFMPELMHSIGIPKDSYICIVPTREFQYNYYRRRPWVAEVLKGYQDKEHAFTNWMERDVLFAKYTKTMSETLGFETLIIDGNKDIEYTYERVCKVFGLGK